MSEKEMHEDIKNGDVAEMLAEYAGPERFKNVFFPLTGRVAFLDFQDRGISFEDKSEEAMEERTAQWAMMDADFSNWVASFTNLIGAILDRVDLDGVVIDGDAPTFRKGDKVLVKDNYHRVWAEAVFVAEWNGFYYTSNDADDGRSLNRWEECKPYESEEDKALDEAIQCGKDEGWIRDETWN